MVLGNDVSIEGQIQNLGDITACKNLTVGGQIQDAGNIDIGRNSTVDGQSTTDNFDRTSGFELRDCEVDCKPETSNPVSSTRSSSEGESNSPNNVAGETGSPL